MVMIASFNVRFEKNSQCGTSAWACNNCPVVFRIGAHCNDFAFTTILISDAFENFTYFLFQLEKNWK